jgi:ergothioneine biosynthesis protein EgtC
MCRFLAYKGHQIFLADLLMRSEQSLIRQSFQAREREEPLNGDGFGVGWYAKEIDSTPCVFTSTQPAWANRNLGRLAEKIRSTCILAHVRAASPGMPVTELNCHPFLYGDFLWMHNGRIAGFKKVRRRLRAHLQDDYYDFIQGTTDSEHVFALFLNQLNRNGGSCSLENWPQAMSQTIALIEQWLTDAGISESSRLNFCVTDGEGLLATRYVTSSEGRAESLYFAQGERFDVHDGHYHMLGDAKPASTVIIASEPLTDDRSNWYPVPVNHSVSVSADLDVDVRPIVAER